MHVAFESLCRGASVSLAAWIGSLPFILWYFHIVTPISLFASLVVVPIAFFILAIALLSLLSTPLLAWLAVIFTNTNWLLAHLVLWIVQLLALIRHVHFYVDHQQRHENRAETLTIFN